jgi:hypothetical protein
MGKMSELHAESAPERADADEAEVRYCHRVIADLSGLAFEIAAYPGPCTCVPERGHQCLACMARAVIDRHGLKVKEPS